ncbi:hypothetical protein [Pseudoalteromonas spongiae]|uniref:hypothetical protein n=1 Tax=Pseudoalteromonas spongiae TaxID=298657 RepID=UPI00026C9A50|nr:hypothetical protein [Pseudoalteromonas spongiae]ATC99583.1 hypothetical protein PSPO_a2673 [Pseudoalteromonas spongiae UST010723-006]
MELSYQRTLAKIILLLQTNHQGCKQEVVNIAKEELGIEVEHNTIREMMNEISESEIDKFLAALK